MNFVKKLNENFKIVLASSSPRRKEIMDLVGIEYDIWPSEAEESVTSTDPEKVCTELAQKKALDVASQIKTYNEHHSELVSPTDILVIGADTIVTLDNKIYGKPADENDAARMLGELSGNTHSVFTGVSLVFMSREGRVGEYTFFDETKVTFYELDDDDIEAYVASGDAVDKAGAYGVQTASAAFVRSIDGDFYNVMGLPIGRILQELKILI